MEFSFNRNQFVAHKLGHLNGEKVIDVGCRDMILKKYLKGNFQYFGIDFIESTIEKENFINHDLEIGMPKNIQCNIINALDVLEHIENIHNVFRSFFNIADKKIIIALPNMAYYKFRFNFLFTGILSGKYMFSSNIQKDRHRWIPNYWSIEKFIDNNTPSNWVKKEYNFIAERRRNVILFFIEKILSKIFPGFFVYEKIYFFEKTK